MQLKQFHVDDGGIPGRQPDVVGSDASPQTACRHLHSGANTDPVQQVAQCVPEQTGKEVELRCRQRTTQRQQAAAELRRRLHVAAL